MFATGNFKDWMIVPKAFITTQSSNQEKRPITSSSLSPTSMDVSIQNDPSNSSDPIFMVDNSQ